MAHEEDTKKSTDELTQRAWALATSIRTCSLITMDGGIPKARPMSAHVDGEKQFIAFLASSKSDTVAQLKQNPVVVAMFADVGANKYVTFSGSGEVVNDRALIKELWSPFVKAWWDSPEDPDIRVLTLSAQQAELWDGPNKLAALALMATAAITGSKPAVGDHAQVRL